MIGQAPLYPATRGALAGLALATVLWGWWAQGGDGPYRWWLSRSAGITAYSLLWLNVATGLLLSGRWLRQRLAPALVAQLHQTLSGMALGFSLFHALILAGDRYLHLASTLWVGAGQLSLGLLGALILSSQLRKRLGNRAWRAIHLTAYGAYWMALAHALAVGTDSDRLSFFYLCTGGSVLWLTTARILRSASEVRRAR